MLLNRIDHLPRDSFFVEALLDDEEFAEQLLNMPAAMAKPRERMSEWSPEREALASLEDRVRVLIAVTIGATGRKPPPLKLVKRPVTAVHRVKKRRTNEERQRLDAQLLPGHTT